MLDYHQKRDVQEQLKVFRIKATDLSPATMVYLLNWIGRTVRNDDSQRQVLEQEKDVYNQLLDSIRENLDAIDDRKLAVVMWALGRLQEKHHPLVEGCQEALLSYDIGKMDHRTFSQVVLGLCLMGLAESRIFKVFEGAILNGTVQLYLFESRFLAQTMVSFTKTGNGSAELFNCFAKEILSRDFSPMQSNDLIQFVWSFAKRGFKVDWVFERIEEELLHKKVWKSVDIAMALWAFAAQGKGSDRFFKVFCKKVLMKNPKLLKNDELSQVVWALGKARIHNESLISCMEHEVLRRGIPSFAAEDRKMLVEGFTFAKRADDVLQSLA